MDLFIFITLSFMGLGFLQVSAFSQLPLSSSSSISLDATLPVPNITYHAPQIFNTLYGAMRQWSSATHHNGMSYFPLTIPTHTILYHGRENADLITGIDWLSFEIEHAQFFTRLDPLRGIIGPIYDPDVEKIQGYFHTYRTTRPLTKLLYLDGLAAGKNTMGSLDTADAVLLHDSDFRSQPGSSEVNRVKALCALSPHIEGIIRMEMGLEIVLCNISGIVQHLSANQRPRVLASESRRKGQFFFGEYARTISQRFGGIGAGRISVDFSSMVSAYFSSMNLTNPDPQRPELPRIDPEDKENIAQLKRDVLDLFGPGERRSESIDWQGVTDMIITRYSDRLAFLNNSKTTDEDLANEVQHMLEHHINYRSLNLTASEEDCATHYLLPVVSLRTRSDQLIHQAILSVMERICGVLFQAHHELIEPGGSKDSTQVRLAVNRLIDWLGWSTWSECGKCKQHEVCFIATWPFGAKEDHYHPGCIDIYEAANRMGYWDADF